MLTRFCLISSFVVMLLGTPPKTHAGPYAPAQGYGQAPELSNVAVETPQAPKENDLLLRKIPKLRPQKALPFAPPSLLTPRKRVFYPQLA